MIDSRISQRDKIVMLILKKLDEYLKTVMKKESKVFFFADKEFEDICRSMGFKYADGDFHNMMYRKA